MRQACGEEGRGELQVLGGAGGAGREETHGEQCGLGWSIKGSIKGRHLHTHLTHTHTLHTLTLHTLTLHTHTHTYHH